MKKSVTPQKGARASKSPKKDQAVHQTVEEEIEQNFLLIKNEENLKDLVIKCLATDSTETHIFVGREKTVEIWKVMETGRLTKHKEITNAGSSIRSVCCFADHFLIVSGLDGYTRIFSIESCELVHSFPSAGGPIWQASLNQNRLVIACDDGCLRLFKISKTKAPKLKSTLLTPSKNKNRCYSCAWDKTNNMVWGAREDGIFGWNLANAGKVHSASAPILATAHIPLKQKKSNGLIPWRIAIVDDEHPSVAVGGSDGTLTFYDCYTQTKVYTLRQHQNKTDILDVIVSHDGSYVYTAGIDLRINVYGRNSQDWVLRKELNVQSGDCNALLELTKTGLLISGGNETYIGVTPLKTILSPQRTESLKYPYMPKQTTQAHTTVVVSGVPIDVLLYVGDSSASIWLPATLKKQRVVHQPTLIATISDPEMGAYIAGGITAKDGVAFIALSDGDSTKLYSLKLSLNSDIGSVDIQLLQQKANKRERSGQPKSFPGATRICFGGDRLLLATRRCQVDLYSLADLQLVGQIDLNEKHCIDVLCVDNNQKWLLVGNTNNKKAIYALNTLALHCEVPALAIAHNICHLTNNLLFIISVSNQFHVFDVASKKWAVKPIFQSTSDQLIGQPTQALGVTADPNKPHIFIWGLRWLLWVDLGNDKTKFFKHDGAAQLGCFATKHQLLTIARSNYDLMRFLPAPYARHQFGSAI